MIIERKGILPPDNMRFICHKCNSQWIAQGEGIEYFIKSPKYLDETQQYVAYCPICGAEVRKY